MIKKIIKFLSNNKFIISEENALAYGVAIGSVIGVLTDNLGLWLSLGIAIGTGLGVSLSKKQKNNSNDKKNENNEES